MKRLWIDWSTGRLETQYKGAKTVRFVYHMNADSRARLEADLVALALAGHYPVKWGNGWLYQKGANV